MYGMHLLLALSAVLFVVMVFASYRVANVAVARHGLGGQLAFAAGIAPTFICGICFMIIDSLLGFKFYSQLWFLVGVVMALFGSFRGVNNALPKIIMVYLDEYEHVARNIAAELRWEFYFLVVHGFDMGAISDCRQRFDVRTICVFDPNNLLTAKTFDNRMTFIKLDDVSGCSHADFIRDTWKRF